MSGYMYDTYGGHAADPYGQAYGQMMPAYAGVTEEVRTIFITGFPLDVKERELNNLLRFLPGYEASQMNWKNGQAQGFALFANANAARAAIEAITQLVFDDHTVLRAEMAHKNMYIKDDSKRKLAYTMPAASGTAATIQPFMPGAVRGPIGYAPVSNTKDNPPCNTLFAGNLSDTVSEAELQALFSTQPGFVQMKLTRNPRATTCFVEFMDVPAAMAVHDSQQGAVLASSDRGGIRIQYSKNPFGKKRDMPGMGSPMMHMAMPGGMAPGPMPGAMPPGVMPPGAMPPGAMPPGMAPGGMMPAMPYGMKPDGW